MMLIGAGPMGAEVTRQGATVKSDAAWLELYQGGFVALDHVTGLCPVLVVASAGKSDSYMIEAQTISGTRYGNLFLNLGPFDSHDDARDAIARFLSAADIMESA